MWPVESQFPSLDPEQWKQRVLTIGPLGNSQYSVFFLINRFHMPRAWTTSIFIPLPSVFTPTSLFCYSQLHGLQNSFNRITVFKQTFSGSWLFKDQNPESLLWIQTTMSTLLPYPHWHTFIPGSSRCWQWLIKKALQDVPGGPVANPLNSQCRGPGFNPWSWN